MRDLIDLVAADFKYSVNLKEKSVDILSVFIADAGNVLANCLKGGGKILACGNGGSACDADHFVCEIANRFIKERDGLAAVSLVANQGLLTAIANDYNYEDIFSRQIKALAKKGDVLLAISTTGNSGNVVKGIHMAHKCKMRVIALTGKNGGEMAKILHENDIEIRVLDAMTPRIQEVHILVIHILCSLIDKILFGKQGE